MSPRPLDTTGKGPRLGPRGSWDGPRAPTKAANRRDERARKRKREQAAAANEVRPPRSTWPSILIFADLSTADYLATLRAMWPDARPVEPGPRATKRRANDPMAKR